MTTIAEDKTTENEVYLPEIYTRRELNAMYREIPLKDTTSRQLRKYFNAMARLYGVIELRKAYEIISEQSPKLVTKEEFFAFAEIARHECEDFSILKDTEIYLDVKTTGRLDWKLIDNELLISDDFSDVVRVYEGQQGKPWYIPPKNELLAYKDENFWEPTQQAVKLREFLGRKLKMGEKDVDIAFGDILAVTRTVDGTLEEIMKILEERKAVFTGQKTLEEFLAVYQNFHNNTRMQMNRGHTPMEIRAMMAPEERFPQSLSFGPNMRKMLAEGTMDAEEMRRDILKSSENEAVRDLMLGALNEAQTAIKIPKVGRNDPCPCGSGKKYKKCCGR